jgi:hypothetical protein
MSRDRWPRRCRLIGQGLDKGYQVAALAPLPEPRTSEKEMTEDGRQRTN